MAHRHNQGPRVRRHAPTRANHAATSPAPPCAISSRSATPPAPPRAAAAPLPAATSTTSPPTTAAVGPANAIWGPPASHNHTGWSRPCPSSYVVLSRSSGLLAGTCRRPGEPARGSGCSAASRLRHHPVGCLDFGRVPGSAGWGVVTRFASLIAAGERVRPRPRRAASIR